MAGTRLPAVRMPQVVSGQEGEEEILAADSVVVDLLSSSKFGFAWPTEQPSPAPLPLAGERPVTLSSSEGETDVSEDEPSEPVRRVPKLEDFSDDAEFITPTSHLNIEQNPIDQVGRLPPAPRLSRAFSMPLPSQLGSLQNPRRNTPSGGQSPAVEKTPPEPEHLRELSLELADSVQMVIQTLLQLSPPQVLDPAKEQFSSCSLTIPTPSICAMFTSMRNLNYMSANMTALSAEAHSTQGVDACSSNIPAISMVQTDFDVGEMLQSVGDALSGMAAQAGVDLVLFHGDVGMKHIAVKGDESGLSYTLSHVARQVVDSASKGDTVEICLFIEPLNDQQTTPPNGIIDERIGTPSFDEEGALRCIFHITHRYAAGDADRSHDPNGRDAAGLQRPQPSFNTIILRRLLRHIGASLSVDLPVKGTFAGRACELSLTLELGEESAVNSSVSVSPEDAASLGYPDMRIANEPSLDQLLQFVETLRGKNATLYASASGSFAHHLSSYLTAWGMNVSHMSTEPDGDGEYQQWGEERAATLDNSPPLEGTSPTSPPERRISSEPAFILVDDDVAVLRHCLQKTKAEQAYPLTLHTRKRPSLANNHRPRSSPQVARVMGMSTSSPPHHPQIVIVHFTSLSNFKLVKDAVQSILTPANGPHTRMPEVIVIPKPAGPRRFLTALHTAVTRPVVDPFFVPTATSPMSPGLHSISPYFNFTTQPKSPGRSTTSIRTASDRSARSPKDFASELSVSHAPPSPLGQSDGMEYFSDAVVKLGASPTTGLLIQSPDGQPTGIFFHPKARTPSGSSIPPSPKMEPTRAQEGREQQPVRHRSHRFASGGSDKASREDSIASSSSAPTLRTSYSAASESSEPTSPSSAKGKGKAPVSFSEDVPPASIEQALGGPTSPDPAQSPGQRGYMIRRQSSHPSAPTSPTSSPQVRSPGAQTSTLRRGRRPTSTEGTSSPINKKGKGVPTSATEGNIVPPISVLIVDDNPINQTILSTFMRKKRIKYDVAKNGEEAVHKWRSGAFHLILMDIQMPVMDGIQATKEIRRIEKQNGAGGFPGTPQSDGQRTPSDASTDSRSVSTPAYRSSVIIVALTASSLQADRVAALAAGCNDFLTKPVSLQWLNSKIIEWGSIKALQMWADIRPEVVRSIASGQTAQAQQVARRLHVPEGRSTTPTAGSPSRSSSIVKKQQTVRQGASIIATDAQEKVATPDTPLSDASSISPQPTTDTSKPLPTVNPLSAIAAMTPSEAAKTLASAHKPQVPVADVQIPTEAVVAAVESAVPTSLEGRTLAVANAIAVASGGSTPVASVNPLAHPSTNSNDAAPKSDSARTGDDKIPPVAPRHDPQ